MEARDSLEAPRTPMRDRIAPSLSLALLVLGAPSVARGEPDTTTPPAPREETAAPSASAPSPAPPAAASGETAKAPSDTEPPKPAPEPALEPATTTAPEEPSPPAPTHPEASSDPEKATEVSDTSLPVDLPRRPTPTTKNPFRGSTLLFDQSILTSDLAPGSQQTYSPLYEWWFSPRAYYWFGEHVRVGGRFDLFKEVGTNHEETTTAGEWRVGDPWLTASYGANATFLNDYPRTRWSVTATVRPPLSKESQANGQYFAAGPSASMSYGHALRKGATFFPGASVGATVIYSHAFTQSTTPDSFTSFGRLTQTPEGTVALSRQVRSGTLAGDTLSYAFNFDLQVLEKLSLNGSFMVLNQFSYRPPDVTVAGAPVPHGANDTRLRQLTWVVLGVDYAVIPELTVGVGYYNLADALGLDGTRRSVFWSPDARLFLSLTANLDAIGEALFATKKPAQTARAAGADAL